MTKEPLTPAQYFAWKKSEEIGTKLAEEHPEIRGLYENSWTLERIANEFDVENNYNASKRVAITSLSYALSILIPNYTARVKLMEAHRQAGARKRYELYGSSFTMEDSRTGAYNLYSKLTKKEKRAKSLTAILAQGKTPWIKSEIRTFKMMCSRSKYLITNGRNAGLPDMEKIAMKLNTKFHNGESIRSTKALSTYKYKHF